MFQYLPGAVANIWLTALLLLWATLLFGGFLLGRPDEYRRMPLWTRITSSLLLVLAGWSWFWLSHALPSRDLSLVVALGMSLGFVGDLLMAGLLGRRSVLGGMAAFGLGHILYIAGMVRFGAQFGLNAAGPRWGALAAWLLLGLAGWYVVVYRGQKPTTLHRAALPYALLLAGTAGVATGLALQTAVFLPVAIGAALFLISDLILAAELFNSLSFRQIGDVIWLTYGPGQMLIIYGAGGAYHLASQALVAGFLTIF